MKTESNYQDLIKLLALICMIIDHTGLYLFPEVITMRVIGRYAMPIFCFFAGYNFKSTPQIKILLYGALLYAFSAKLIFQEFIEVNILISIFLGQIYIRLFQRQLKSFWPAYIHIVILASLWSITHTYIDYGSLAIAIMVLGYIAGNRQDCLKPAAAIVSFFSLLHSLIVFYNFEPIHVALTFVMTGIIYISLTVPVLTQRIRYNINFITRHTLIIYCLQFVIIETYWRYYLIG
jgi:hypothetical protein